MNTILKMLLIFKILLAGTFGYAGTIQKLNYFVGGGGEPSGASTIFDNDLKIYGNFIDNSDWTTKYSFNGGHKNTNAILKTIFNKAKTLGGGGGHFSDWSYNNTIEDLIKDIESGKVVAGDQLMLTIFSHGYKNTKKEKTHVIATSGEKNVNLDSLEKLAQLATDKGIKLALIDMSCFSGNLLKIKNDNVCMISSTGPEQMAYIYTPGIFDSGESRKRTFSAHFFDQLKQGKNLEEVFLAARPLGVAGADFPMISTPEGIEINNVLYKLMSPYLAFGDNQNDDFIAKHTVKNLDWTKNQLCIYNKNHEDLQSLLKQLEKLNAVSNIVSNKEFESLRSALDKYMSYQKSFEATLLSAYGNEAEIISLLEKNFPDDKAIWELYAPMEFAFYKSNHIDKFIKEMEDAKISLNDVKAKELYQAASKLDDKLRIIAKFVQKNLSSEMKEKIAASKKAKDSAAITQDLAFKVSLEAKKVYNSIYKKIKKPTSNACRDFIL